MKHFPLHVFCIYISLAGITAWGFGEDRFRSTPLSESKHCRLLESSLEQIRLEFSWPPDDTALRPEIIYLAIPRCATTTTTYDRWHIEILQDNEEREILIGSDQSATEEEREKIYKLLEQSRHSIGQNEFFFHEVRVLRIGIDPDFVDRRGTSMKKGARGLIRSLKITINFSDIEADPLPPDPEQRFPGGFPSLYQHLLFNHEAIDLYRTRPEGPPSELNPDWATVIGVTEAKGAEKVERRNAVKILTQKDALYALRTDDLRRAGVDPRSVDLSTVSLWSEQEPCPFLIVEADENRFGEKTALVFRARQTDSPYTRDAVFWLIWGQDNLPRRPATRGSIGDSVDARVIQAVTETLYFEEDQLLGRRSVRLYEWFWKALGQHNDIDLVTSGRSPESPVTVSICMFSRERVGQTIELRAGNSTWTDNIAPDREKIVSLVISATDALLSPTMDLSLPRTAALTEPLDSLTTKTDEIRRVFLSSYRIQYLRGLSMAHGPFDFISPATGIPMQFEVADCTASVQPVLLAELPDGRFLDWTGTLRRQQDTAQFTVVSNTDDAIFDLFDVQQLPSPEKTIADHATNLHDPKNSADVLVLAHRMFIDPVLDPWLEWRREQGYRVRLIDVQDVYDEFNNGQPSCESIKDFLAYTLLVWQPPLPQYVVLIGDASWDHRDNEGTGIPDLLPSYVPVETPEYLASDIWYVYIFGGPKDTMPEMILGRISVRSVEEMKNVIEKVLTYEKNPEIGPWRARNIFVNDDTFERDAFETTRVSVPPAFETTYVNQSDFPHVTLPYLVHLREMEEKYSPACTDAIIESFNEGGLILQYYGHGGNQMWSHERIFMGTDRKVSDVLLLANSRRLPLVVNWSCLTGYVNFNIPPFHVCLSEELLRQPRKGAIVAWSPSENGSTEQHRTMAHHLIKNIGLENRTIVGDAIEAARMDFSLVSVAREVLMQYILFGDPLVRLSVPTYTATITVQPEVVRRGKKVTLSIHGTAEPAFTGTGTVWVLTEKQRELGTATNLSINSGSFTCEIEVRVPLEEEHLRIRLYGVSQDGKSDTWGGTTLPAQLANLVVQNVTASAQSLKTVKATWTVANRSSIEAPAVECRVRAGLALDSVPVPKLLPNATITLSWQGPIEFPTSIEVWADPADKIREENENDNRATARVVVGNTTSVIALVGDTKIQPENPSDGTDLRISIPFSKISPLATASVSAWLVGLPSDSERRDFVLNRSQKTDQLWTWKNVPAGNHNATLVIAVNDLPSATVGVVQVSVSGRPDLAFTQGTLRYEPPHPIVGQSVYLITRLYNIGNAPAHNVRIAAYDGPKQENRLIKEFKNRSYARPRHIPIIEPGDGVDIRLRWDTPGFRGVGPHDVTIVADPTNLIPETDETNNEDTVHLTIYDLPDLTLNPWDDFQYLIPPGAAKWGQLIPMQARVRNVGDSVAERVRMSFLFNGEEYSCFFPTVKPGVVLETQTALPSYHGKNTLEVQLDRYDLIAEKDETGAGVGNNLSKPKHLYLLMRMPPAPEENDRLLYHIEDETEFSAGVYEYTGWMPAGGLGIPSDLEEYNVGLVPTYVLNSSVFSRVRTQQKWFWQKKYDCFIPPSVPDRDLQFRLPAPNGKYEVSIEVFSNAWVKNASGVFFLRCQNEREFRRIEHYHSGEGYMFKPIGLYHVQDDEFPLILRSASSPDPTSFYKVKFKRSQINEPAAAGYPSALFPAGDFERKRAVISWDATIPPGTDLGLRARWWERDPQGKLRPFPWPRLVPGQQGELEILGKGDFVQFYAIFARYGHDYASPVIRSVTISIESAG